MSDGTHYIICKNPKALKHLYKEETSCYLIAAKIERGELIECGDALLARDELLKAGFEWGRDFYLLKNKEQKNE